mmetsp:Transcript_50847/g.131077  ORF Transcript_50847/g.131077 Transcript_50847/m.131077 type:complete len:241 (+) Transcript_50847:22-744(+)
MPLSRRRAPPSWATSPRRPRRQSSGRRNLSIAARRSTRGASVPIAARSRCTTWARVLDGPFRATGAGCRCGTWTTSPRSTAWRIRGRSWRWCTRRGPRGPGTRASAPSRASGARRRRSSRATASWWEGQTPICQLCGSIARRPAGARRSHGRPLWTGAREAPHHAPSLSHAPARPVVVGETRARAQRNCSTSGAPSSRRSHNPVRSSAWPTSPGPAPAATASAPACGRRARAWRKSSSPT